MPHFFIYFRQPDGEITSMDAGDHETAEHALRRHIIDMTPGAAETDATDDLRAKYSAYCRELGLPEEFWAAP